MNDAAGTTQSGALYMHPVVTICFFALVESPAAALAKAALVIFIMIAELISHVNGVDNYILLDLVTVGKAEPLGTSNVDPLGLVRVVTLFFALPSCPHEGTLPPRTELAAYLQWLVP